MTGLAMIGCAILFVGVCCFVAAMILLADHD